ncbi:MAG: methylmalonyl-CoA mutase family protein [Anaerolineae bacterium]
MGFFQREIADAAARYQAEIDNMERIIVGVNEYEGKAPLSILLLEMDPEGYDRQCARLEQLRRERDDEAVLRALNALATTAEGEDNLMPYILDAVKSYATLQEIMDTMRQVFGEYTEPAIL